MDDTGHGEQTERTLEKTKGDLRTTTNVLRDDLRELRDVVRDAVRDSLHAAKHRASNKYEESEAAVTDYVRDNPIKALAIAAGVGAFLGLTLFRR